MHIYKYIALVTVATSLVLLALLWQTPKAIHLAKHQALGAVSDFHISQQHPFRFQISADDAQEHLLSWGVIHTSLYHHYKLRHVEAQLAVIGYGALHLSATAGVMDMEMKTMDLRDAKLSGDKLNGEVGKVRLELDRGIITIEQANLIYRQRNLHLIKAQWSMQSNR